MSVGEQWHCLDVEGLTECGLSCSANWCKWYARQHVAKLSTKKIPSIDAPTMKPSDTSRNPNRSRPAEGGALSQTTMH